MADAFGFPADELEALAAHFENIAKAWTTDTPSGQALRDETFGRATVCRRAITKYDELRQHLNDAAAHSTH